MMKAGGSAIASRGGSPVVVEGLLRTLLEGSEGRATLRVVSGSMRPCLQEGDLIEVDQVPVRALWPGDLVVFQSESAGIVVHRLIWRDNPLGQPMRIYTKGDALGYLDHAASAGRVLGRVRRVFRGEKSLKPVRALDRVRSLTRAARHGLRRLMKRRAVDSTTTRLADAQEGR